MSKLLARKVQRSAQKGEMLAAADGAYENMVSATELAQEASDLK